MLKLVKAYRVGDCYIPEDETLETANIYEH